MNILCYGDSNTWGYSPGGGVRFDVNTRWPAVMARRLGEGFQIFEEGLNGRTIGSFMPYGNPLNGLEYLKRILPGFPDLDMIILGLGINDLFQRDDIGAEEIALNIGYAIELIQNGSKTDKRASPAILVLSPLPVHLPNGFAGEYRLQIIKSESMYEEYRKVADAYGVRLIETGSVISSSIQDGVHIEAAGHRKLGTFLSSYIRELI